MFFVLSALSIYLFKVYLPNKVLVSSITSFILMLLLRFLNNEDPYISSMQKKKRFIFLLLVLWGIYLAVSLYLPTLTFGLSIVNITRVLCDRYKAKRLNNYFGGYEVF